MPIYMTARFEVQKDKLMICEEAIREFVEYVRENEPDTLRCTLLEEKDPQPLFALFYLSR